MVRRIVRRVVAPAALAVVLGGFGLLTPGAALAQGPSALTVSTAYPKIETQAGSAVRLSLDVTAPTLEAVDLNVNGLTEGWQATLRGGGFVIHSVTAVPDKAVTAELELVVPPDTPGGEYPITINALGARGDRSDLQVTLAVVERVNSGIKLAADFPSLSGDPGSAFNYNLTVTNDTPEEQTFTFDPSGPQGWEVTASPTAQSRAQTVTIEAGSNSTVKVTATPPDSAAEGSYPISVNVRDATGATGTIELTADVTGTPVLSTTTADQRLNVSGGSNSEKRIPLVISNTGTGDLLAVKLAATAPDGWDVSFDPKEIAALKPGEASQATAVVKPASDAVAGDYAISVRSSAGSQSSNLDLRYSLKGSRAVGLVAIGVIAAAFVALGGVFVRFGRR